LENKTYIDPDEISRKVFLCLKTFEEFVNLGFISYKRPTLFEQLTYAPWSKNVFYSQKKIVETSFTVP
jgi:hypothetical protein